MAPHGFRIVVFSLQVVAFQPQCGGRQLLGLVEVVSRDGGDELVLAVREGSLDAGNLNANLRSQEKRTSDDDGPKIASLKGKRVGPAGQDLINRPTEREGGVSGPESAIGFLEKGKRGWTLAGVILCIGRSFPGVHAML